MTDPNANDIGAIIQAELAKALGGAVGPANFADSLAALDPADSDAALEMLDFLLKTGRLQRVGVLDGGAGYLFCYAEPKGSSKAGYRPGATQGDRIVDAAVEQTRASGKGPVKKGMCKHCFSVVFVNDDGDLQLDGEDDGDPTTCTSAPNGRHEMPTA